jgi:SAM-dependent methyltransferase
VAETVPAQYFVDLYKHEADPWNFETSAYERAKYEATLAALPRARYSNALEIACSVGVFTDMLAQRCDELLAVDVSPDALNRARARCASHAHVRFAKAVMPHEYPGRRFDLTTVCEMGFYLARDDLLSLREQVVAHLLPCGHVILVHWTPPVDGHASTTEEVHEAFRASPFLRHLYGATRDTYRLDVLERVA